MYTLSDQQIEFIRDDLRARGIARVSLQHDLLDHICCLIEDTFDGKDDFEGFYRQILKRFYRHELAEIEEETIRLLTFKQYYTMKKIMLGSGTVAAVFLTTGIALKFLHLPGAAIALVLGVFSLSFLFLPLLFLLRMKEKPEPTDKAVLAIGAVCAILVSLGILFKMMHWPGANIMVMVSLGILLLVFLPIFFFSGIRRPERKVNTLVSSMLIVAGSGLLLMLVRTPSASHALYVADTGGYVRSEQVLTQLRSARPLSEKAEAVLRTGDAIKSYLVGTQIGSPTIPVDFEERDLLLGDHQVGDYLPRHDARLVAFIAAIEAYNRDASQKIDTRHSLTDTPQRRLTDALCDVTHLQMEVLLGDKAMAQK